MMKRICVLFCFILVVVSGRWGVHGPRIQRRVTESGAAISWPSKHGKSRIQPRRSSGQAGRKIAFPLLNDVQAAGRTPMALKQELEAKLRKYVSDAVVTVSVRAAGSQKFYVVGEVATTGEYPLLKPLTVLQAFALAGGFTEWAAKDEIILLRVENGKNKTYRINYKEIVKGENLEQNLRLKADDTIIVP